MEKTRESISKERRWPFARMLRCARESLMRSDKEVTKADMDSLVPRTSDSEDNSGVYDYSAPVSIHSNDDTSRLIKALGKTDYFKRLEDIRFLGALDYCLILRPNGQQSNARFTRAQHSIGVAALARTYLSLSNHSPRQRLLCVAAAMLHDIGHPPFSHTLEPVFKEKFGIDHHEASERIILGSFGSTDIPNILKDFGLHAEEVIDVLNGNDASFDHFFSGPINFDTIEGILRSRNYLKMQNLGITPIKVVSAATLRNSLSHQEIVDYFWLLKDEMYNLVIRSRTGVLFDSLFQEALRDNIDRISEGDLLSTETLLFKKIPAIRDATQKHLWKAMSHALLPKELPFQARRFHINLEADFFSHADRLRYRQSKHQACLTLNDVLPA